ncbi:MAG TPA: lysophospholipid acyltransferase family protein [Methylomirabilota bacterium]|nr:lysophospholipid acyltransferase family protein [Methylomirabilota bacterium]
MKAARLGRKLAPAAGSWALRLLAATLRLRREEKTVEPLRAAGAPAIYVVWHARLLLLPYLYRRRGLWALVSRSEDGSMISDLVRRFGFVTVRGSSSRGGAEGLRALARAIGEGHSVVVVPDGPRGPREVLKAGVVVLARLTGAPVVPAALAASSEWRARSWDEFRIPKPFSRCVVRFGEPILVPRDIDAAGEEISRKEIEAALNAVTWQVDEEARR